MWSTEARRWRHRGLLGRALVCAVALTVALGWPATASALKPGEMAIVEKAPEKPLGAAALAEYVAENRVTELRRKPGKQSWRFHVFAHLRFVPSAAVLGLRQNNLGYHLAFYRQVEGRWIRDNADGLNVRTGAQIVHFSYRIGRTLGLLVGVAYELRLTVLDARDREIVLARTSFTLR